MSLFTIFAELDAVKSPVIIDNVQGEVLDVPVHDMIKAVKYFNIRSLIEVFTTKGLLSDYGFNFKYESLKVLTKTRELGAIICIQNDSNDAKKMVIIVDTEETTGGSIVKRIVLNGISLSIDANTTSKTINQLIVENC